ncbi:hypothetical protein [Kitasatospora sp. SC0581]|uniref:hypothetical protein n=1 Tax=Kitasatospora sp. SC0581 TaxID=3394360 RepID=UPI003A86286C
MIAIRMTCDTNDVPFIVADLCRMWHVHDVKESHAENPGQRHLDLTVTRRQKTTK